MTTALSPFEYRPIKHDGAAAEIINPYVLCSYKCRYCYCHRVRQRVRREIGIQHPAQAVARWAQFSDLLMANNTCQYSFIGTAVDPYSSWERRLAVTRQILVECTRFERRVVVATKSHLVLRDADILRNGRRNLVLVSLASLSPRWRRSFEPTAPSPQERLRTIEALAKRGIDVGVFVAPILPTANDDAQSLADTLEAATGAGAQFCIVGLGLPTTTRIINQPTVSWREELSTTLCLLGRHCAIHQNIAEYMFQKLGVFGPSSLVFPDPQRGFAILKAASISELAGGHRP